MINFEVLMPPVAKARARTVIKGDHAHSFTPRKTVEAEQMIRMAYFEHIGEGHCIKKPMPISLEVVFVLSRPSSAPKRRPIQPTKRPDIDNLLKTVLDALNGYAFEDDSQIIDLHAWKEYGAMPKIIISLGELSVLIGG